MSETLTKNSYVTNRNKNCILEKVRFYGNLCQDDQNKEIFSSLIEIWHFCTFRKHILRELMDLIYLEMEAD